LLRAVSEADTTLVDGLGVLSTLHFGRGEFEQAYLLAERAWRADAFHREPQEGLSRLFTYSFEAEEDLASDRWCRAYAARLPDDWFGSFCRLTLMAWSRSVPSEPDSALAIAARGIALAPRVIRPVVGAQLHTTAAGSLAAAGRRADARRVLGSVRAALAANPETAREPFGTDLLRMEAEVRLLLGDRDTARALIRQYLMRLPGRETQLLASRRLRGLR
jgi:hypothetical protein